MAIGPLGATKTLDESRQPRERRSFPESMRRGRSDPRIAVVEQGVKPLEGVRIVVMGKRFDARTAHRRMRTAFEICDEGTSQRGRAIRREELKGRRRVFGLKVGEGVEQGIHCAIIEIATIANRSKRVKKLG